jgi:hypothetical protein
MKNPRLICSPRYLGWLSLWLLATTNLLADSNPFAITKGSYQGLFSDTNQMAFESSGFISAVVTDSGAFSGKILFMGKKYSGSGQFAPDGTYSNTIPRTGMSSLNVFLQLDLTSGDHLTGQIDDGVNTADIVALRAVYSKTIVAPQAGNYTLVFPRNDDSSSNPGGNGFATVKVDASGNVTLKGLLGDGTKISQKALLVSGSQWPLYVSLYSGKGCALGWLTLTNGSDNDIDGVVTWIKLAQPAAKLYAGGFTNQMEVEGSTFQFTSGVPILNFSTGEISLSEGNLSDDIKSQFTLGAASGVTSTNGVKLKFTTTTGAFKGTVFDSISGANIPVNGVVLQNQNNGFGYFLGTSESGPVLISLQD